ncbi:hypothetical protein [Pseudocolwellia agarivorans]|uniref:hypothetical protein n=1 Tax=Pseudocolwellia agarivorans TaxID=1911682 RepID=UPI0009858867|nr:hypothetical protein [Pseudocolwellia agarivorans]
MKNHVKALTLLSSVLLVSSSYAVNDHYIQPKLNKTIGNVLNSLGNSCQNFKADTESDHALEIGDHHQSFELSHQWSDGTHTAFIDHSETGNNDYGQILAFTMGTNMFDSSNDIVNSDKTMSLRDKLLITEQHPSGMAWLPAPRNSGRDRGYLFIASENENKVRVRGFSRTQNLGQTGTITQNELNQITDVWLAQRGNYTWLMLHNMNADKGVAYKALTSDLFQYNTSDEGNIDLNAFQINNNYRTPSDTGCGKSIGQNAQLVQDSSNKWYVVHSYTGGTVCGSNIGSNHVKAYQANFNSNGTFTVSTNNTPAAQATIGNASGPTDKGADGASGFRVTKDGRLVAYLGAQYAYSSFFNWKSSVRECRSAK